MQIQLCRLFLIFIALLLSRDVFAQPDINANCSAASITYWANEAVLYKKTKYRLWGVPTCTNKTVKWESRRKRHLCWYSCGRVASVILRKAGCQVKVTSDAGDLWKQMEKQFEYSDYWRKGCLIGFNSVDLGEKGKRLERLGPREPRWVAYRHVGITTSHNSFVDNGVDGGVNYKEGFNDILGKTNYHYPLFLCPKR